MSHSQGERPSLLSQMHTVRPACQPELEVNVHEVGAGRPIVYLHGLLGLNEHWLPCARALAGRARSVMIEVPLLTLRGSSAHVRHVADICLDAMGEHAAEPAVLVGSSFGGHVALRIALSQPRRVRGVVLVGASGLYEVEYEDEIEQNMRVRDVEIRPTREWLERKIAELFHDKSTIPEGVVERVHEELSVRRGARAMVKLSRSSRKDKLIDQLRSVQAPTQLIWGRQDIVTPPQAARDFASNIPDSRIAWLDDCGHAPMIEQPEHFTAALAAFLDELETRESAAVASSQEVA